MSALLAQIRIGFRQTKREHAAWCRAWDARAIVTIDGGTYVPAHYLRALRVSDYRSGCKERRQDRLGHVLAGGTA